MTLCNDGRGTTLCKTFGSQTREQARPGSDIDVAVRWIRRDWEDVGSVYRYLSSAVGG
jgi:predicted nucleotidyltransferase